MKIHKGKYVVIGIYFFITVVLTLLTPIVAPLISKNVTQLPASLVPDDADKFAREYISNLKAGNYSQIAEMNVAELEISQEQVMDVTQQLSNIKIETGKVVSVVAEKNLNVSGYEIVYEFQNNVQGEEYLDVQTIIYNTDAGLKLAGLNLKTDTVSAIKSATTFDFKKQGLAWSILILLSLFVTWSAMNYMKKSPNPRWWVLLVIIIIAMKVEIFPADAISINFGPFVSNDLGNGALFVILVPLGALYYWIARKKIFAKEQTLLNTPIIK